MPINAKGWVFIPGNHSIRVVDIINNRCFVFLKSGFNVKFIESDANIRLKYQWLKAPKVIQKKACWYEEQRLVGLPWNRLSSDDLKKKVIIRAQNHLLMLYQKTTVKVSMKDYVSKISNSILIFLETNFSSLLNQEKDIIKNFVAELGILLNKYSSTVNIDLVCTHGDFQPGNILCTEDDFWIIDWEYSDQRSIYYDALVFDLESRFPAGLSRRFKNKINNLDFTNNYLIWVGKSLNSDKNYYFYVFFLEDLLLRLNELSVDLIYAKSEALSKYLSELLAIQGILKAQIKK